LLGTRQGFSTDSDTSSTDSGAPDSCTSRTDSGAFDTDSGPFSAALGTSIIIIELSVSVRKEHKAVVKEM